MPRDNNGELRLLLGAELLAVRAALHACERCGYVRAAAALHGVLARDSAERGPRIMVPYWGVHYDY